MSARRMLLITVPLLSAMLALSACGSPTDTASTATPTPKPSASATTSATATATATAVPEPTPGAHVETGEPVGVSCNDLISPQQMYDFNPNFGLIDGFVPLGGSLAGQAVAANGLACRWMNQSSGDTIDVSVAKLDAESIANRKAFLAASSTPVSSFGPDGYFDKGDLGSSAQAFPGKFWLTATSIAFFGDRDAVPIIGAAADALG
ncbi:hypothetical protein QMG83_05450 [Salinibacterium sp. G-O1]|uniref:hypothetical protein n=1 Tax=Salinibacterium sp. G-O1 TaxID=3046208 RepID=UPI0024B9CF7E|nr:hypothetical protein [Salinibacterium sp. G-O1]MDJ0334663.1 hypothetical protein [Salinibacterium sp. G-O1]